MVKDVLEVLMNRMVMHMVMYNIHSFRCCNMSKVSVWQFLQSAYHNHILPSTTADGHSCSCTATINVEIQADYQSLFHADWKTVSAQLLLQNSSKVVVKA